MDILIFISLLIIGGLLNLIIKSKAEFVYATGRVYIFLVLLKSIIIWIYYFAGIKNAIILKALSFILYVGYPGTLILGYLIIYISGAQKAKIIMVDNDQLKKITWSVLLGLSISTGNIFLVATVGKAENLTYMKSFFTTSGYATWFLYFIMTAETLGGLGILLHFKLKTGPLAATGLLLIMAGAVYTHWHNADPFSDSYAAVIQFITLSLIMVIYYFEKQAGAAPQPVPTS